MMASCLFMSSQTKQNLEFTTGHVKITEIMAAKNNEPTRNIVTSMGELSLVNILLLHL